MNWNDLKVFLAVARSHSLRKAAQTTGLSLSTVGRRIDALEVQIGAKLFERRPDGYLLTSTGQEILDDVIELEKQAQKIEQKVIGLEDKPQGSVAVTLPDVVFSYLFADSVNIFCREEHQGIDLKIIATYEKLDLVRGEADIALRFTNTPPEQLVGRKTIKFYHNYYASASFLKERDLDAPADAMWIGRNYQDQKFSSWIERSPYPHLPVRWDIKSFPSLVAACKGGLGMTVLPCFIGDQEPELVRVGQMESFPHLETWLLVHPELKSARRIRVVMDYLSNVLNSKRALLEGREGYRLARAPNGLNSAPMA